MDLERIISAENFISDAARGVAINLQDLRVSVDLICEICHNISAQGGWWTDLATGESIRGKRNIGELLALVHSEISEAFEGSGKMDDHLPHRAMVEVELADAYIRIGDLAGANGLRLGDAAADLFSTYHSRSWGNSQLGMLEIHADISRALEGHRKNKVDSNLPHLKQIETALAMALLHISELAFHLNFKLGPAIAEKLAYNLVRADHKIENRKKEDGKKF